jgi:D-amino-acid dehydrogenase
MQSWATRCTSNGVAIRENRAVDDVVIRNGRAIAVRAGAEDYPAEAVIIAAGAWTPLLHRLIGVKVPIQPGKGLSITTSRPVRCPKYPLIFEERRVAVTPFADSYRVGSTMEFAGYDTTINPHRLELLKQGAAEFLQEPLGAERREEWMGWRPMVPDGLPIIGRAPRAENLWLASGHGMLGVTLATGTAKLIAELIAGQAPHVDPTPFRVGRF